MHEGIKNHSLLKLIIRIELGKLKKLFIKQLLSVWVFDYISKSSGTFCKTNSTTRFTTRYSDS